MKKFSILIMTCLIVLTIFPDSAVSEETAQKGINAVKRGDYVAAIDLLTIAIDSYQYSGESLAIIYYNRGLSYLKTGKLGNSIADCTEAINLKPDLGYAYSNRGLVYYKKGNRKNAIADLKTACAMGIGRSCAALQQIAGQ